MREVTCFADVCDLVREATAKLGVEWYIESGECGERRILGFNAQEKRRYSLLTALHCAKTGEYNSPADLGEETREFATLADQGEPEKPLTSETQQLRRLSRIRQETGIPEDLIATLEIAGSHSYSGRKRDALKYAAPRRALLEATATARLDLAAQQEQAATLAENMKNAKML